MDPHCCCWGGDVVDEEDEGPILIRASVRADCGIGSVTVVVVGLGLLFLLLLLWGEAAVAA